MSPRLRRMGRTSERFRFIKFSAVGVIGIGVQLAMLSSLTRCGVNYLLATALAVESAVLHNFCWHRHFTWEDRPGSGWRVAFARLLRFHVSNGAISLLGNLLMMRVLVGSVKLPAVFANLLSIAVCGSANFVAGDRWVFMRTRVCSRGTARA